MNKPTPQQLRQYLTKHHNLCWTLTRHTIKTFYYQIYCTYCICGDRSSPRHRNNCRRLHKRIDDDTILSMMHLVPNPIPKEPTIDS